jgi:hypothetical protein
MRLTIRIFILALAAFLVERCEAQAYSPVILKAGQIDSTSLKALTDGIYLQAGAKTEREKAEAIWRFLLTDGRFVKPGFWYHIAGWAYEEPLGEVLDPIKLLNSYGFGLCYHIAPLLEAAYDAGGFDDARVWFLTGHTVAEVFYQGKYHYFDSDMMGYNPEGSGPLKQRPVASVHDIEQNGNIILGKLAGRNHEDPSGVDVPWYPADVRANAIGGLAELFTTTNDNWLYPFKRYSQGHTMDFVLRPGERMVRYFRPETNGLYYLPYSFNGVAWHEFPTEIDEYHIRTEDGPRSQKDARLWATGKIEYRPQLSEAAASSPSGKGTSIVFDMPCPYVIIDARYAMNVSLSAASDSLTIESSVDGGHVWTGDASVKGPFHGPWNASAAVIVKSEHGELKTVTGTYGYKLRITQHGNGEGHAIRDLVLTTVFQSNPRSLPELARGKNELAYRATGQDRTEIPVRADHLDRFVSKIENANYTSRDGQGFVTNCGSKPGEITFALQGRDGSELAGFDAGGRFLDLRDGLAPDKLTAEVRSVEPWPSKDAAAPAAKISWALKEEGPYQTLWRYDPKLTWKDGKPISRTLRWPEVDKRVDRLPPGARQAFVRYTISGMAIDDFRLAAIRPVSRSSSPVQVTQIWKENGIRKSHSELIDAGAREQKFNVSVPEAASVENEAVIIECLRKKVR